ncbi:MAG: C40 family peptidase [Thermoguttaceae bacterium]
MFIAQSRRNSVWLLLVGGLAANAVAVIGAEKPVQPAGSTSAEQRYFETAVRTVEPALADSADRLAVYLQLFRRELVNDTRLFPCQVDVQLSGDSLTLTGLVEFDENRTALENLFQYLGFGQVDNRVEVLPSRALGEKRFGLVRAGHSFSYDQPAGDREVLTDCLLGTGLFLLKETEEGYYLCHAMEGYVGYVDGRDICRVDAGRFTEYQSGCHVRLLRDTRTDGGLVLPTGARLKLVEGGQQEVVALLPDGSQAEIPSESCRVDEGEADPRIERVIATAERLLGTPYVWGGNTSAGIDCSGLVQTAFAAEGITLARDSNQQVLAGRLVATRWHREGLRRGDLLYFLNEYGKISHTAISLGGPRFIEAVRPVVRYSSFDRASAEYSRRAESAFCFAKRLVE